MERFYYPRGESIVLGVNNNNNNREIERAYYTSPSTPNRNSDVDFDDVFGGPPRRSSVNETRHSLTLGGLHDLRGDEEGEASSCPWPPPEREKPVFGEDSGIRRRYLNKKKNNDFFDDIFGGEESPRMRDREPLSSRVLSPARPLPSPADPIASSLPSAFSLPAKLTKGMDLPTFGSSTRSWNPLNNINDGIGTSDGLGSSDSHLSRFSSKRKEESKNDLKPAYRQSLLSEEFSERSISDKADKGSNMKQDQSISEVSPSNSNGHFHFSIYKWASKGVPLVMPLRAERKDKLKLERCSSAKEWMVSKITTQNDSPAAHNASFLAKNRQEDGSTTCTTIQNGADSHQISEQIASAKAQSDTLSSLYTVTKDVPGSPVSREAKAESSTHSVSEMSFSGKTEAATENKKLESKSLRSLLNESDAKQDYDELTRRERGEESKTKSTKKSSAIFDVNVSTKKPEEKTVFLKGVHSKAASQGSLSIGENMGKYRVKGKVKEFVRIFNQEAVTKPRADSKSQVSTYKQRDALRTEKEVEGYPEQSNKDNIAIESSNTSANNLSQQDDISASAMPDISFAVIGDKDGSFHGNFTVQVLAEYENEDLQNQDNQAIQVIDNKIQQWSKGKEGNIRSLLSTLQYVLWPDCGWKPVPLVDIIEGNAVKRAYQRALLCLHPDKLQQKGAASHQKYLAEKVFDILQEAWTHFNVLGAL